jgi:hypothetical protein
MNDGQLSSITKAMIEAAKADVPSAAVRAKVWTQVSGTVGAAAAGGGAVGAAAAGSASAAKLLVVGALLGGTLTVGLAVTMLRVGSAPSDPHLGPTAVVGVADRAVATRAVEAAPTPALPGENTAPATVSFASLPQVPDPNARPTSVVAPAPAAPPAPVRPKPAFDPLEREAQLVSEARGALVRGDPQRALQAVRGARALPSHQLAPEELAVEAQALRALGRSGDAIEVDEALRSRFPESALAR